MAAREETDILFAFYGDDFSGSTATAEALTETGVPTVIFAEPPAVSFLSERFPKVRAVGVASVARTLSIRELDETLPPIFETIKSYRAPVFMYKVCSTFDSSREVGSIGRAIEIGRAVFLPEIVPVLPAAPKFGRFTVFGHHFAALGQEAIYRLDRHPSMAYHPITPMRESDLRLHLSQQTTLKSGLINVLDLNQGREHVQARLDQLIASATPIVLFDCLTKQHLELACEVIWQRASVEKPAFFAGSHELGYGFGRIWQRSGMLHSMPATGEDQNASEKGPLLVLSGSCATVNGEQIDRAVENGFYEIEVQPQKLLDPATKPSEEARIVEAALCALHRGGSVIMHTAKGPKDHRIEWMKEKAANASLSYEAANDLLGDILGEIGRKVIQYSSLRRMVVAGGDTSGRVQKHFGIQALQVAAPSGIGVPLCYAFSNLPEINGLEIAFKGGQVGDTNFFSSVRAIQTIDFEIAALGNFPSVK